MVKDAYHHGNLKEELIKKTIELISLGQEEDISMRKLAELCSVSRQAPYSHFESKEELLKEVREYIAVDFASFLEESIKDLNKEDPKTLGYMGYAYIGYFKKNPAYFDFIYNKDNCKINLTLDEVKGNYLPYEVFRKECVVLAKAYKISDEQALGSLIRCWSIVHGAASLVVNKNITLEGEWDTYLTQLFTFKAM